MKDGTIVNWIIETKGYEDENVPYKDVEGENWCRNATTFTRQKWKYLKVPDRVFRDNIKSIKLFESLISLFESQLIIIQ